MNVQLYCALYYNDPYKYSDPCENNNPLALLKAKITPGVILQRLRYFENTFYIQVRVIKITLGLTYTMSKVLVCHTMSAGKPYMAGEKWLHQVYCVGNTFQIRYMCIKHLRQVLYHCADSLTNHCRLLLE